MATEAHSKNSLGLKERETKNWSQVCGRVAGHPRKYNDFAYINIEMEYYRDWSPGQFVMFFWGEHLMGRPFSIFDWKKSNKGSVLTLFINSAGDGTKDLIATLKNGDPVFIRGPLGQLAEGLDLFENLEPALFWSEGSKAPAVFSFLNQRLKSQLSRHLPLDAWWHQVPPGSVIDAELMSRAYVKPEVDYKLNEDIKKYSKCVLAGSQEFLASKISALQKYLDTSKIWLRIDEAMGCGIGLCYSCTVFTKGGARKSCVDGPWFLAEDFLNHIETGKILK